MLFTSRMIYFKQMNWGEQIEISGVLMFMCLLAKVCHVHWASSWFTNANGRSDWFALEDNFCPDTTCWQNPPRLLQLQSFICHELSLSHRRTDINRCEAHCIIDVSVRNQEKLILYIQHADILKWRQQISPCAFVIKGKGVIKVDVVVLKLAIFPFFFLCQFLKLNMVFVWCLISFAHLKTKVYPLSACHRLDIGYRLAAKNYI